MTSSIKPPGGPPAPPQSSSGPDSITPDGLAPEGPEAAAGARFAESLEGPVGSSAGSAPGPAGEVVRALRAGEIDLEHAVSRLVEGAVHAAGDGLSEAGRAELASFLRASLEEDPNLQALLSELDGG